MTWSVPFGFASTPSWPFWYCTELNPSWCQTLPPALQTDHCRQWHWPFTPTGQTYPSLSRYNVVQNILQKVMKQFLPAYTLNNNLATVENSDLLLSSFWLSLIDTLHQKIFNHEKKTGILIKHLISKKVPFKTKHNHCYAGNLFCVNILNFQSSVYKDIREKGCYLKQNYLPVIMFAIEVSEYSKTGQYRRNSKLMRHDRTEIL